MYAISNLSPSFTSRKPKVRDKDVFCNLKEGVKTLREINPDSIRLDLTSPGTDTIEINIPYKKLNAEGRKATENLLLLLKKFNEIKDNKQLKVAADEILATLKQILSAK